MCLRKLNVKAINYKLHILKQLNNTSTYAYWWYINTNLGKYIHGLSATIVAQCQHTCVKRSAIAVPTTLECSINLGVHLMHRHRLTKQSPLIKYKKNQQAIRCTHAHTQPQCVLHCLAICHPCTTADADALLLFGLGEGCRLYCGLCSVQCAMCAHCTERCNRFKYGRDFAHQEII